MITQSIFIIRICLFFFSKIQSSDFHVLIINDMFNAKQKKKSTKSFISISDRNEDVSRERERKKNEKKNQRKNSKINMSLLYRTCFFSSSKTKTKCEMKIK